MIFNQYCFLCNNNLANGDFTYQDSDGLVYCEDCAQKYIRCDECYNFLFYCSCMDEFNQDIDEFFDENNNEHLPMKKYVR